MPLMCGHNTPTYENKLKLGDNNTTQFFPSNASEKSIAFSDDLNCSTFSAYTTEEGKRFQREITRTGKL